MNCKTMLLLAMGVMLTPVARAGTYSIVGIEWYPSNSPGTATGGGYIHFDPNNPLDLDYGVSSVCGAPQFVGGGPMGPTAVNSVYQDSTMMGTFRWKVRWVGAVGEVHPDQVLANVQYKGTATCSTSARDYSASADAKSKITDPYFGCGSSVSTSTPGYFPSDSESPTGDAVRNSPQGAAGFSLVAGTTNTWDGYVLLSVNSGSSTSADASGGMWGTLYSVASASATMDVIVRLTQVDGQQVQTSF